MSKRDSIYLMEPDRTDLALSLGYQTIYELRFKTLIGIEGGMVVY